MSALESHLKTLQDVGAIVTDSHIVYTSGKHGSSYVNKDAVYPHTALTRQLCLKMADAFREKKPDAVLAPAVGGVILSQWVAQHLTDLTGREVLAVYAEPTPDKKFVIKRGYDALIRGKKVLVVEDVMTTGGSVRAVVEAAKEIPCDILGIAALCNRGGLTSKDLGQVPRLFSLFEIPLEAWDADDCPLCKKEVPINTALGKGRQFLENAKTPSKK